MLGEAQRKAILDIREELDKYLSTLKYAEDTTNIVRLNSWDVTELSLCSENFKLIESKRKDAIRHAADVISSLHNQIEELNNGNRTSTTNKYHTH